MRAGIPIALALAIAVAGCGGGGAKVTTAAGSGPTIGQELLDLRAARDAGIITPNEYERKRAEIMNRN